MYRNQRVSESASLILRTFSRAEFENIFSSENFEPFLSDSFIHPAPVVESIGVVYSVVPIVDAWPELSAELLVSNVRDTVLNATPKIASRMTAVDKTK